MRRLLAVLVLLAGSGAHADDLDDEPRPIRVTGELRGATAVFQARYLLRFEGPVAHQATTTLAVPQRAVATRAAVRAGGVTHALELVRAEGAKRDFEALSDRAPGPKRRWAVMIEAASDALDVSIAAPRDGAFTLEVELQAPTCWYRDVRYVVVPPSWRAALAPALRRPPAPVAELAEACDHDEGPWVGFPAPALARRPAGPERLATRAGGLDLGDLTVARVELEASRLLGEAPRDLATVVLLDASRSMTQPQLATQRELVRAYVRDAAASRVQVIAYARTARALLPDWTKTAHAWPPLQRALAALVPRNGSNFDVGLVEAGRWLARTTGPRRIVLVTDEVVASRLRAHPEALAATLPTGTLVHVVVVSEHGEPERDDHVLLAPLAAATGGMAIRTGLSEDRPLDATLLVRPRTIDRIAINAPGWTELGAALADRCGDQLVEGRACAWWGQGAHVPGPISIEGSIWGRRIVRVLQPDPARQQELARVVSELRLLDEAHADRARVIARAVNKVWSLFAAWGGDHGYTEGAGMIRGMSCCGGTSSAHHTVRGIGGPVRVPPPPLDLEPQLASVARCGLAGEVVEAAIETTLSEIVDVELVVRSGRPSPAVLACITEAIWDAPITVPPSYPRHTARVVFGD